MNRLATHMLSLILLAHALTGCCWHHAHSAKSERLACNVHCHGHVHEHSESSDESHQELPCHSCREGRCLYVRGADSPSIDLTESLALDGYLAIASEISPANRRIAHATVVDSPNLMPHIRLHLLNQILLI